MISDPTELLMLILVDAFWAMFSAMGFAILFNVPRRALPFCMINGALGHATRAFLMNGLGFSIVLASLLAAMLIGFIAHSLARHMKMPAMIFSVSGVIPMVPGVLAFRMMLGILSISSVTPEAAGPLLVDAAVNGIQTALTLGALASGIVAPALLFHRSRPVV